MKRSILLLIALFCLCGFKSVAQLPLVYTARLQAVLDSMCSMYNIKGASAAVYVPGKGMWKGVYGESYAGNAITSSMAFPLNSNTKTYVAALMLKLQEDGVLQLSDTIGTWIQNQPNINGHITIRQLLNHTSGIYNYTSSTAFSDSINADFSRIWQPNEILGFVGAPLFVPGASWSYSNTNYLLAGMIIAQVTGMPVEQAIRTKLLNPQGLSNTWFYPQETPTAPIPHFWFYNGMGEVDGIMFGYTPEGFYSAATSAGAIFSTAEDNAIFWHKLIAGDIINNTSLNQWRQTIALNTGIGYGLGVFCYKSFNGHVVYEHGGTGAGAINENLADSVTGVSISVLTNQNSVSNSILLNQVVRVLHQVTIDLPMGIYAVEQSKSFKLYPNPAQNDLQIQLAERSNSACTYTVVDALGRVVQNGQAGNTANIVISVSGLQNGIYYLHLADAEGSGGTQAFTVQH